MKVIRRGLQLFHSFFGFGLSDILDVLQQHSNLFVAARRVHIEYDFADLPVIKRQAVVKRLVNLFLLQYGGQLVLLHPFRRFDAAFFRFFQSARQPKGHCNHSVRIKWTKRPLNKITFRTAKIRDDFNQLVLSEKFVLQRGPTPRLSSEQTLSFHASVRCRISKWKLT